MLKLDFLNKEYTLKEVIDTITDGDISNFKNDEDFLNFVISWSLGNHLEGDLAYKFKTYTSYDGLLNMMKLDEYGYFGKKMYKIYEICGKDKKEFIKTCDLIGEYSVMHRIDKKTIDTNLKLKEPVLFVDNSVVLSSGKKPVFSPNDFSNYYLSFSEEQEFNYEMEKSLRHRINESIKKNNDEIDLLEELPSFKEWEMQKREERKEKSVPGDYEIDVNNLYFGISENRMVSGSLNMHMASYSWFEYTNTKIMNYYVFRSVPIGNFYLLDEKGNVHSPEVELNKDNKDMEVNQTVDKLEIIDICSLFKERIKKEEQNNDELTLLGLNGLLEQLESNEKIKVSNLKRYEPVVRDLFDDMLEEKYNGNNKNYK